MTNAQPPHVGGRGGATNEHRVNGKVWVVPQLPAPTPSRSRAQISRAMVTGAALALVAVFAWAAMSRPAPPAADSDAGAPTSTEYEARPNEPVPNTGWATQPIDQATAVPGSAWVGWAAQPAGRCSWLPPGLLAPLGVAAAPVEDGTTCRITFTTGDQIKIRWGRASPMLWDPIRLERPATIGGFAARVFEVMPRGRYSQACQVSVHTRGFSDLAVLASRDVKTGGATHDTTTAGARCPLAHRASELVVRGMVPAAGGRPWSKTPQTPSPAALAAQPPCELLTRAVDDYLPADLVIRPVHDSTARGPQCTITTRHSRVVGLFTRRLADLPVDEGMAASPLPIGLLTARTEHLKDGCAATVEVAPGRTIRIQYKHRDAGSSACDVARMFLVRMIQELLNHTT